MDSSVLLEEPYVQVSNAVLTAFRCFLNPVLTEC